MKKCFINLKTLAFAISVLTISQSSNAQTATQVNLNQITPEKCGSAAIHNLMMNDPQYAARMQDFEQYVQEIANSTTPKTAAQYRIPVVVHVLHKGEAVGVGTNVSEQKIRDAIKDLNDRYRKTAGTGGFGNGVDVEIEFALAVRDPNGNCTNGITRVDMTSNSTYMSSGVQSSTSNGITDAQVKATASWNKQKYYNIYLVSEMDNNNGGAGVQGYAYFASSHGTSSDGAVILASNFTSGVSMTTTHELGHALNLYHTFEGDGSGASCPSQANGCGTGAGDCCGDIPRHKRSQSDCNVTGTNSCDGNSSNALFARNYMDYASDDCVNMFTANQKTRALAACSGPRASFFAAGNLALTPVSAPIVAFQASNSIICSGQTVTFTDISACVPNTFLPETNWSGMTFNWTFTNGATVLTSTLQNPTMTFTVPGSYDVTLTVTTAAGTDTHTENDFVVLSGGTSTACTPTSTNAGNFAQTISRVVFNTIDNSTDSYTNTAYTNFTCSNNTIVQAGNTYNLSITGNAGPSGAQRFEVYIDYNNDGVFSNPSEMVHSGTVAVGTSTTVTTTTLSANITIPATAVTNALLRMRVLSDAATITSGKRTCGSAFFIGDVEDYGVYISAGCSAAPAIATQPAASTICASANTSFSVASTGATSYQWQVSTDGGNNWTNLTNTAPYSTTTTASLTITGSTTAISTFRYRCITTNDCGTTNSAGVVLTVNPTPTVASTTPGNRCGTGTVNLAATASAGTLNWFTALTGGTSIGTGAAFTTPSISATTTYYVSATNSGCTSARTAVVATVNQNVTLTSNPANATICAGSSATLTAAGGSSYTWTGGQTTTSITVSPTTTTTYTVTGVTNCTASASVTITVNPLPNTALSAFPTVCNYNPAFALTQGTPAGGTYSGTGVSGSNFNPATAGIGTATITYSVTQNGCTKSVTGQIIVSGCAGLEDQQNDDLLILYPNPVEGWMTIEGENLSKYQDIELRDEAGRLVGSWKVDNVKTNINLSAYAAGNYTVSISNASNQVVKKIQILK